MNANGLSIWQKMRRVVHGQYVDTGRILSETRPRLVEIGDYFHLVSGLFLL
jgi:hypothetical protein